MKSAIILIILMGGIQAKAQLLSFEKAPLNTFFNMKNVVTDYKAIRTTPTMVNPQNTTSQFFSYWQGALLTSYSGNGRFRATHSFDMQGLLRETRASFSLKKSGVLSYWRIQLSSVRTRPLLTYTIH